jgi:hypothetical protein
MVHLEVRKYKIRYGRNWIRTSDPLLVREILDNLSLLPTASQVHIHPSNNVQTRVQTSTSQFNIRKLA